MRPQYNRRAMRATAALCAAPLAAGIYGAAASASTAGDGAHRADPTAPIEALASVSTAGQGAPRMVVLAPMAHFASASVAGEGAHRAVVLAPTGHLAGATTAGNGAPRTVVLAPTAHLASVSSADPGADRALVPAANARARRPARSRHGRRGAQRLAARMLHRDLLVGQDVAFIGALRPAVGRERVDVQAHVGWHWIDVATTRTTRHGHFIARYWPHTLGAVRIRLRVAARQGRIATVDEPAAMVFHEALVSWYGPGGITACGEELGAGTLGVANLTLPCGTRVTLRYGGRTVTVPVIDRGPYVAGREFDLTYATKQALGAGDLTIVWASS